MLKLKPVTVEGLDCLVNAYLTLLQQNFGEYQYAFWDTWVFCYEKSSQYSFGEAINIPMSIYHENIKKYYCADIQKISIKPWQEFKFTVLKLLERDVPIIVSMDTYYCNWYANFKKTHSEHTVIIGHYEHDCWNVIDTVPPRVDIQLADEDLRAGILSAQIARFSKRKQSKNLQQFLEHTLSRKKHQFEQEKLEQFVKDFDEINLETEITYDTYVWTVPMLRNIRRIYYSRKQFLEYVFYLKEEQDESLVSFINDRFTPIIVDWAVIMNVLYKMQISHRVDQQAKIKSTLEAVAQKEKEFTERLMKAISCSALLKNYVVPKSTKFIQLQLAYDAYSHFFETVDFVRKTDLNSGELWIRKEVEFVFPKVDGTKYNCMRCKGQTIALTAGKIETIHLIGYATWGNQISNYQITDVAGNLEGELMISDWCVKPQFGEIVLWEGEFVQKKTNLSYTGHIFDVKIPLYGKETVGYLKLPDCKEIVLFAIVNEVNI